MSKKGPNINLDFSCHNCEHVRTKGYTCQGDSGSEVHCNADGTLRYIGDTTWRTPEWCPLRHQALADYLEFLAGKRTTP